MSLLGGSGFRCSGCQLLFPRKRNRKYHRCSGRRILDANDVQGTNAGETGVTGSPRWGRKRARSDFSPEGYPADGPGALESTSACKDMTASQRAIRGERRSPGEKNLPQSSDAHSGESDEEERMSACSRDDSRSSDDMSLTQCSDVSSVDPGDMPLSPCSEGDSGSSDETRMNPSKDDSGVLPGSPSVTSTGSSPVQDQGGRLGSPGMSSPGSPPVGDEDQHDGSGHTPWLENIHESIFKEANGKVVDGEMPSMHVKTARGTWAPFENYTTLCLALWAMKFKKYAAAAPLQGLFDVLRMTHTGADGIVHKFDPSQLPLNASHFVRDVRKALPLLRVYEFPVPAKGGKDRGRETHVVSFALNEVLARNLRLHDVVNTMRQHDTRGGHVLSRREASECGMKHEHVLAVPSRHLHGKTTGYLSGRYSRRNPDVGIESVVVGSGDTAHIGDSVIVAKSMREGEPAKEVAVRLAGLFFDGREGKRVVIDGGESVLPSPKSLRAEIRPYIDPTRVDGGGSSTLRGGGVRRVWESIGEDDVEVVDVSALQRLCSVQPEENLARNGIRGDGTVLETLACAGFVRRVQGERRNRSRRPYDVATTPWLRRGDQGLQFDLRGDGVYHPRDGQPVAKFPIWAFSDAFNAYNQNGTQFSVNATYAGVGCVASDLERRLGWSHVISIAGPGGEWQPEHKPFAKILEALQRGCRAKMALGPGDDTEEVFVRAGLQVMKADSVYANELCDVKKPSTSEHACSTCMVSRIHLGDDEVAEPRTTRQIVAALQMMRNATSTAERYQIGKETGVVLRGDDPNPYRHYAAVDTVKQIPPDIFHQDALNTKKNLFFKLMDMMTDRGKRIVSCTLMDRRMYPAREERLRDITKPSGLTSMTGMDFWRLAGILLPVFRMCFTSEAEMILCVKQNVIARLRQSAKIANNPAYDSNCPRNADTRILAAFRKLLVVSSAVTSDLRLKAFDEEILQRLHDNLKSQVTLFDEVLDLRLPTLHAGLHVADSIREHGTPVNCCRGEAKHQELKKTMSTCSGRPSDLLRHFARRANDSLAVRALVGRVPYEARVYMEECHEWERRQVVPSEDCASVVGTLWSRFHAGREGGPRVRTGKPRGSAEWDAMLREAGDTPLTADGEDPGDPRNRYLPDRESLANAYSNWFGCKRGESVPGVCASARCLTCLRLTAKELTSDVRCADWTRVKEAGAPFDSNGTVVMGSSLGEWASGDESQTPIFGAGGSDVVCSRDEECTLYDGGERCRPLVRILLFFTHRVTEKTGEEGIIDHTRGSSTLTTWAVGLDYTRVEARGKHVDDGITELPMFNMRHKRKLFPVQYIDSVVHMVHACSAKGTRSVHFCELEDSGWRHNEHNRRFLLNDQYERGMA